MPNGVGSLVWLCSLPLDPILLNLARFMNFVSTASRTLDTFCQMMFGHRILISTSFECAPSGLHVGYDARQHILNVIRACGVMLGIALRGAAE